MFGRLLCILGFHKMRRYYPFFMYCERCRKEVRFQEAKEPTKNMICPYAAMPNTCCNKHCPHSRPHKYVEGKCNNGCASGGNKPCEKGKDVK